MKKRSIWLGIGLISAAGILLGILVLPRDPICTRTVADIWPGMQEGEVESVLGKHADHQYHPWEISPTMKPASGTDPEWEKVWIGERGVIIVHFDARGAVCSRAFVDAENSIFHERRPDSFLQRVRRFLGQ